MKKQIRRSAIIAVLAVTLLLLTVPVTFASGGNYHKVRYGETLFSIGRLYGVNPYRIAYANHLRNPDHIYAGQVLHIPSGSDCDYSWSNCNRSGYDNRCNWSNCNDSGYGDKGCDWSNCNRSGYDNRCNWSNCNDSGYGYKDCDGSNCNRSGSGYQNISYAPHDYGYGSNYHVVRRGETLTSIARRYGVSPWTIAEKNRIYNLNRIYAGQVLRIPSSGSYY